MNSNMISDMTLNMKSDVKTGITLDMLSDMTLVSTIDMTLDMKPNEPKCLNLLNKNELFVNQISFSDMSQQSLDSLNPD